MSNFAEKSTMHGFRDYNDTSNVALRVMWVVAMTGSVGFLAYQTKLLFDAYWGEMAAVSMNMDVSDVETTTQTLVYCSDDWIDLRYPTFQS